MSFEKFFLLSLDARAYSSLPSCVIVCVSVPVCVCVTQLSALPLHFG